MGTVLLIRHAATDHTGRIISSWSPGVHLNTEGRQQAEGLAARLASAPIAGIYSSPLERAMETAERLAGRLGLEVVRRDGLGEVRYGDWTGCGIAGMRSDPLWARFCAQRSSVRPPGGETLFETQARVVAELAAIGALHAGGMCVVFSHSDAIRAALAHFAGIPLDLVSRVEIGPASITALDLGRVEPRILCVNDTGSASFHAC